MLRWRPEGGEGGGGASRVVGPAAEGREMEAGEWGSAGARIVGEGKDEVKGSEGELCAFARGRRRGDAGPTALGVAGGRNASVRLEKEGKSVREMWKGFGAMGAIRERFSVAS